MGYTHYWKRKVLEFERKEWNNFIVDVKKILANMPEHFKGDGDYYPEDPIKICGWKGTGEPEFNDVQISFNGDGPLSHESFLFERKYAFPKNEYGKAKKGQWKKDKKIFDFCKTKRKPYSFLAEVVLLLAKYHFHDRLDISSDGDEEDWKFSTDYFSKMFPTYAITLKLDGGMKIWQ